MGDTKLERFLPKNQHIQRILLNFEFWINGKLSKSAKIGLSKSIFYVRQTVNTVQVPVKILTSIENKYCEYTNINPSTTKNQRLNSFRPQTDVTRKATNLMNGQINTIAKNGTQ